MIIKDINMNDTHKEEINSLVYLLFVISMSFDVASVAEFFDGRCFALAESLEVLQNSYELIKQGFFKEAFFGLRSSYELGLYSIYFDEHAERISWLHTKSESPRYKKLWKKIKNNTLIASYDEKFPFKPIEEELDILSNYVHTNGIKFSYTINRTTAQENYDKWYKYFLTIVETIVVLHLLKFPILSHSFEHSFLIGKFGAADRFPFFGGMFGNYDDFIKIAVASDNLNFIRTLTKNDLHMAETIKWLNSLPDLSDAQINSFQEIEKEIINRMSLPGGLSLDDEINLRDSFSMTHDKP